MIIVEEIAAKIGAKIDEGEFADVFALFDHVADYAAKAVGLIQAGVSKGFEAINKVAERGDYLDTIAEQFGEAAQSIQELGYAAVISDAPVGALENSLKFLSRAAVEASQGSKEALRAFGHVKLKDANGQIRAASELISDLSDEFAALPNGPAKAARAIELFGRSGAELVPLLNRGSAGIEALREEARKAGIVLSQEAIQASAAYDLAAKRFGAATEGIQTRFAAPLIARVTGLFSKLTKILQNPGTLRAIDALSKGFDRFLSVVGAFVDFLDWLSSNEETATAALFAIQVALAALGLAAVTSSASMIAAAVATAAAWVVAALPFLTLGALIVLITDELWTFAEGGDTVLGDLIKWFDKFDPSDSPLIELLKAALSLIFDLTDTKKWQRLSEAIAGFFNPLKQLAAFAGMFQEQDDKETIAQKFPGLANPLGEEGIGAKIRTEFPGLQDPLNLGDQTFAQSLAAKFPGIPGAGTSWGSASGDDAGGRWADFMSGERNQWAPPKTSSQTTIDAPISIVIPPSVTDAQGVGEEVRRVVREELGAELSNANAASGG